MIYIYKGLEKRYPNAMIREDGEQFITLNPGDTISICGNTINNFTRCSESFLLYEEDLKDIIKNSKVKEYLTDDFGDKVDHPSHYCTGDIECIDAMISAYGKEAVQNFCICNAFKYLWRFNHKNGTEDVDKMIWYMNKFKKLKNS